MSKPLVTCICLTTRARREWLPRAIECFAAQTYAMRELLIIAEDAIDLTEIRKTSYVFAVRSPQGLTLGAKHNYACSLAMGDLIAKWDDDDWSAPGRIADQVARLESTGREFTGYSQMKFTDGARWWRYVAAPGWPLGTSLVFAKSWWRQHQFPDRQKASDNPLCLSAQLEQQPVAAAGDMMVAAVHPGNTNQSGSRNGDRPLHDPTKYLPLDPAREAVPAALANWPRAEAFAC